jgi:hypothetical protein
MKLLIVAVVIGLLVAVVGFSMPGLVHRFASEKSQAVDTRVPPKPQWPFLGADVKPPSTGEFDPSAVVKRNYYFVLDASGSMGERKCAGNERKLQVAKRALLQFAQNIPGDSNLGVLVFDQQGVHGLVPIGPKDPAMLRRALAPVTYGGETPLAQAIRQAYGELTHQAIAQLGYGEYHLVVVTDGEATGEDPRAIVDKLIGESPVVLHTIGFCIGEKHSLNQPGRTLYHAADSPTALEQGLKDVLAEAPAFHVSKFK